MVSEPVHVPRRLEYFLQKSSFMLQSMKAPHATAWECCSLCEFRVPPHILHIVIAKKKILDPSTFTSLFPCAGDPTGTVRRARGRWQSSLIKFMRFWSVPQRDEIATWYPRIQPRRRDSCASMVFASALGARSAMPHAMHCPITVPKAEV